MVDRAFPFASVAFSVVLTARGKFKVSSASPDWPGDWLLSVHTQLGLLVLAVQLLQLLYADSTLLPRTVTYDKIRAALSLNCCQTRSCRVRRVLVLNLDLFVCQPGRSLLRSAPVIGDSRPISSLRPCWRAGNWER